MPAPPNNAQKVPRHRAMLAFVTLSLLVTMSLDQTSSFARGSLQYWLVVLPALLLPLLDLPAILKRLFGEARLLLVFLVCAGGWHLAMGDVRVTLQLFQFILVLTWISTDRASINVRDLTRLYMLLVVVGVSILLFSDFNRYGLIPGRSDPAYGLWRVSFFPNIAYTGILSMAMVLVLTRSKDVARQHPIVLAIATYFLVFSFVRAAQIAAMIYLAIYYLFLRNSAPRPIRMFWIALLVAFGFNLAVLVAAQILFVLQNYPLVSTLFLRGETNLSIDDILFQLYRPWLWRTHFHLFFSSPGWMGWGSPEFYQRALDATGPPLPTIGSESLPTRLLASYGIAGALFTVYLVRQLRQLAFLDDRWACACFPAVFVLMMNWGSVFHPSDSIFVILLLIMTKGSKGFVTEYASTSALGQREAAGPVTQAG
jgi:hypothetical protein